MSKPKKVGIVSDNIKVKMLKKELLAAGFTEVKASPFTATTTTITVDTTEDKVKEVYKICQRVELHFKRGN